jgi:hypothetical protein
MILPKLYILILSRIWSRIGTTISYCDMHYKILIIHSCIVRIDLIILLRNIIFYISSAIYYILCSVLRTEYSLSFGSKLDLLPKLNRIQKSQ